MIVRAARPEDHGPIAAVVDDWWGRPVSDHLMPLFFEHFHDTSLVVEDDLGQIVGFLVGFLSQSEPSEAYIHFVGVAPTARQQGIAANLYHRFFSMAQQRGRSVVRAITSPINAASIAFHRAMGFAVTPPDETHSMVQFTKDLDS